MKKQGSTVVTEIHRSCMWCEYHDATMVHSGKHPLYHHRCQHPLWKFDKYCDGRIIGDSDHTPSWCPLIPEVSEPEDPEKLITEEWLKSKGFRLLGGERIDERTKPEVRLRRLAICGKGKTENIFSSPDDLCIDIAPNPVTGGWYVWLHQAEPYRFIHIRQFRYRDDLERLYEALTGASFDEEQDCTGL